MPEMSYGHPKHCLGARRAPEAVFANAQSESARMDCREVADTRIVLRAPAMLCRVEVCSFERSKHLAGARNFC